MNLTAIFVVDKPLLYIYILQIKVHSMRFVRDRRLQRSQLFLPLLVSIQSLMANNLGGNWYIFYQIMFEKNLLSIYQF